jgi:hypothetical protein
VAEWSRKGVPAVAVLASAPQLECAGSVSVAGVVNSRCRLRDSSTAM